MSDVLQISDDGHLRVLRLNRPERKNACNGPLFGALARAFRAAAADDEVWVVALTGNGDAFCSGLDLDQTDDGEPDPDGDAARYLAKLMRIDCPKPIVAGINGAAVGFGMSLAMAADIRIAAPSAKIHPGYARVGTSPDGGSTWTVTQALGHEGAMRFFLESRAVPAAEALERGLVGEVTATDDDFEERFGDYCRQLATVAPLASRQTKQLVSQMGQPTDVEVHLAEEVRLALIGLSSEDGQEAIRAMLAREQPQFRGR